MKKMLLIISILLSGIIAFAQEDVVITETEDTDEEPVYVIVEQMPEFPGGTSGLRSYIAENVVYPEEAQKKNIQGTVYARFVVLKDGSIGKVEVQRGIDPLLDAEAERVIKSLPKFEPATQSSKPVKVWLSVPVSFKLN